MEEMTSKLLRTDRPIGVVGYGVYIPRYRLPGSAISQVWKGTDKGSPVKEKAVAGLDEDTVTISIEAARNALARAGIDPGELRAVWIGSESHPYAVKPSSTIVAEAIGATPNIQAADMEFACKAGSEAMVMSMGIVGSGMGKYALAVGADTAQGRPGDALEYTAASGGAAYILGPADESLAIIEASYSFVTDTPDFWRRSGQKYPSHGQRFTGEPAYFKHVRNATTTMLNELGAEPGDFKYVTFHQPNPKFPSRIGKELGFTTEQITPSLLAPRIGNTYAGASLVGNTAAFDIAEPDDRVLMVSYGSGAGSDAFAFQMTDKIAEVRNFAPTTEEYIARRKVIDYATYVRFRRKLAK